jgi:hypothetical protein
LEKELGKFINAKKVEEFMKYWFIFKNL